MMGTRAVFVLAVAALAAACGREDSPNPEIARIPLAIAPTGGQTSTQTIVPHETRRRGPVRAVVALVTIGTFPRELADAIEHELRDELQVDVTRRDDVPLPREAYFPARRRYRADRLLAFLHALTVNEPITTRVLGLTGVDISTTKGRIRDWGVFGLGDLGGRASVISTFRLHRGARDDAHFRFRVVTTAVHEVGHTLGLEHCTEPTCLMRDAEGSITTIDTSDGHLGPLCRDLLDRASPLVVDPVSRP